MALDARRPPRRGRAGLRVAGRPAAARRLLAPVLPGRPGRAGQARRQRLRLRGRRRVAPLAAHRRPRASSRRCGRWSRRPSTSCSTCRRPAARSSGPATPTARRGSFALLTGSSSICHSLRCAIAIAELLGHERPDWELSAARLAHVIRARARGLRAQAPLGDGLVLPGARRRASLGDDGPRAAGRAPRHVRRSTAAACAACRDRPWITVAETCECALAHLAVGERDDGRATLFGWAQQYRARRRPLLDRHRVPRRGPLPRRRASHLHRRRRSCSPPTPSPAAQPAPAGCSSSTTSVLARADRAGRRRRSPVADRDRPASTDSPRGQPRARPAAAAHRDPAPGARAAGRPRRATSERSPTAATSAKRPLERRQVDLLVRRAAAVGRVGEHVVDDERAAGRDVRRPELVVEVGRLVAVAAVDEQERQRRAPSAAPTVGESPTTATTVPSRPASWIVRRKNGSVSILPTAGSTRSGSCHSQPGWFSSEPRWWSTANSTVPRARGRRRRGRRTTCRSSCRPRAAARRRPRPAPPRRAPAPRRRA